MPFCSEDSAPMFSPPEVSLWFFLVSPQRKGRQKETQGELFGRRLCDVSLCAAEHRSMAPPAAIRADAYGASLKLCSPWPLAFGSWQPPPGSHSYPSDETHERKEKKYLENWKQEKTSRSWRQSQAQCCKQFLGFFENRQQLCLCWTLNVHKMYLAQRERQRYPA